MPHAEVKYSSDLTLDTRALLQGIEAIIQRHDAGSGDCKGRAYRAEVSHHTHLIVEISMLAKPHRDLAFIAALRADIADMIRPMLPRPCWLSINIAFSGPTYMTEFLR